MTQYKLRLTFYQKVGATQKLPLKNSNLMKILKFKTKIVVTAFLQNAVFHVASRHTHLLKCKVKLLQW